MSTNRIAWISGDFDELGTAHYVKQLALATAHRTAGDIIRHEMEEGVAYSVVHCLPRSRAQVKADKPHRVIVVKILRTGGACLVVFEGILNEPNPGKWCIHMWSSVDNNSTEPDSAFEFALQHLEDLAAEEGNIDGPEIIA